MADLAREADPTAGVTPLGRRIVAEIHDTGPIGVDRFMALVLGDETHGYYRTRDPLGTAGDFTTSPEISQTFGEIIGAFLATQWQLMGSPPETVLAELGPGRGTLMADILRALRVLPACRAAMRVHLVETSPTLRERQQATLDAQHPDVPAVWHEGAAALPEGPLLLVANEFFDALPVQQYVFERGAWHRRRIGVDGDDQLVFVTGEAAAPGSLPAIVSEDGTIFEIGEAALAIARRLGGRLARAPGTLLIVDYGHGASGFGDTLQAVRRHRFAPVLDNPGDSDLTTHVDFAALANAIIAGGGTVWPLVSQRIFLQRNGIELRAAALRRNPAAGQTASGIRRLLDPAGMGSLFKVLAATSPGLPCPSGFQPS